MCKTMTRYNQVTFGDAEIFVVNTFLHVGEVTEKMEVHSSISEPLPCSHEELDEEVLPVASWKTYDSYDDSEPLVHKVSTLEFFEKINAYNTIDDTPVARRSTEPLMESISTYDFFEDEPMFADPPQGNVEAARERANTFDPFEDSPRGMACAEPLAPPVGKLCTYDPFEDSEIPCGCPELLSVPPCHQPEKAECVTATSLGCSCTARGACTPLITSRVDGKEQVRWKVDGRKLESQEKQMLSPEFELDLPKVGPTPFRLMILAKETRGKGCRGFLKAKGCGRLFIKCGSSSLPEGIQPMGFRVTVGAGSSAEIKAVAAHEFSEHPCCPLQKDKETWDLLVAIDEATKRFEVLVEVL